MKNSYFFFFIMLIFSTLFSISANTWIGVWMGMEINLMMFMPLISSYNNNLSNESSLKYFLIQSIASSIFILSSMSSSLTTYFFNSMLNINTSMNLLLILPLMLKLGAAPFHNWFISVVEGLSWFKNLIFLTWQKITPLFIIMYSQISNTMMFLFIMMSAIMGAVGGLNQTSLRKIMAFSSINHMSWMFSSMLLSKTSCSLYFLFYCILSSFVLIILHKNNAFHYINLYTNMNMNKILNKFTLTMCILSLGGLPPLLGFIPKWYIIQNLILLKLNLISIMLVFTSLITLYFYSRMMFPSLILNFKNTKIISKNLFNTKMIFIYSLINMFTIMGIFMFPIMY